MPTFNVGVIRGTTKADSYVTMTPEAIRSMSKPSSIRYKFYVESGAGLHVDISDAEYASAGALLRERRDVLRSADVVLWFYRPKDNKEIRSIPPRSSVIGYIEPSRKATYIPALSSKTITALSLYLLPESMRPSFKPEEKAPTRRDISMSYATCITGILARVAKSPAQNKTFGQHLQDDPILSQAVITHDGSYVGPTRPETNNPRFPFLPSDCEECCPSS